MALTVETGEGVQDADAYASRAFVDAYWTKRTHDPLSSAWAAQSDVEKRDGAIREATSYLDAVYGPFYRGFQRGRLQGLLFPRIDAVDDKGYPLPDLPEELKRAVAELAARRISGGTALAPDVNPLTMVTKEKKKIGPIEKETEYGGAVEAGGANAKSTYGIVDGLMNSLVTNGSGGAGMWAWT